MNQMRMATGRLTLAYSTAASAPNTSGTMLPSTTPAMIQRATQRDSQRSKSPIVHFTGSRESCADRGVFFGARCRDREDAVERPHSGCRGLRSSGSRAASLPCNRLQLGTVDAVFTIGGVVAVGVKRLPGDALRIGDPGLVAPGITAGGIRLLDERTLRRSEPPRGLDQFIPGVDLNPEMVQADTAATRRDREVHAGVVEHPLRIVVLLYRRLRAEQGRVEADRVGEVADGNMYVQALHGCSSSRFGCQRRAARRAETILFATAAILGEIADQCVHRFEVGG